jgi:hypothetical protein
MGLVLGGLWVLLLVAFYNRDFYRKAWKMLGELGLAGFGLIWMMMGRDSHFVLLGMSVGSVGLLAVTHYLLSNGIPEFRSLLELLMAPVLGGFRYARNWLSLLFTKEVNLVKERLWIDMGKGKKSKWSSLLGGLVVGIPVVMVLTLLLSSGDPVFGKLVQDWIDKVWQWNRWTIRVLWSVVMGLVLVPALVAGKAKKFVSPLIYIKAGNFKDNYLVVVVMVMVAVVMGLFLVIQWPYVFATVPAETDLSRFGVATYSEYVTKGFVEFLLVTGMIYGLVWGGLVSLRLSEKDDVPVGTSQVWLKWVQMLVLGLFVVFLLSVFRRIWLYQLYHGLTLVRVYGGCFLGWVSLLTVTLGLRHWGWYHAVHPKFKMVNLELGIAAVVLLLFGLVNVERLIAVYDPPTVNGQVDHVYLVRMSADGYEGWLKTYEYAEGVLNREYEEMIGKDERREVAYAGFIVSKLVNNYQRGRYFNVHYWLRNVYSVNCDDGCLRNAGLPYEEFSNIKFDDMNSFDRWLGGNGSEERAYLRMKSDMPLDKLQELERRFYELRRRVLNQPEEERLFEIDISLETPLLF